MADQGIVTDAYAIRRRPQEIGTDDVRKLGAG